VLVEFERVRFEPTPPVTLAATLRKVSIRASGAVKTRKNGRNEAKVVEKASDERGEQKTISRDSLLS
jgi:hypothetical protein